MRKMTRKKSLIGWGIMRCPECNRTNITELYDYEKETILKVMLFNVYQCNECGQVWEEEIDVEHI